jgi:predicted metal-dependent peptidase
MAAFIKLAPYEALAAARLWARRKWPYYAVALNTLLPREMRGLGTLGVSEQAVLLYDPETLAEWTTAQLGSVLVHEVLHLLRRHAARAKTQQAEPEPWNWACDAEINDDLIHAGADLPDGGITPTTLGQRDGLTAEEYYRGMQQQGKPQTMPKPGPGSGRCGGCAGNPLPEEADGQGQGEGKGKGKSKGEGESEAAGEGAGDSSQGAGTGGASSPQQGQSPQADKRPGIQGRSPAELERVRRATAEAIQAQAQKGQGTMPGGWARWADAQLEPPRVPWQAKLARVVRGAVAYRPGTVDYSYSRPSRRQSGLGYGPGVPVLPALVAPQPRVAVVVDTSGSMGQSELAGALAEVRGILRAVGGQVELCACDAAVHELRPITDWHQAAKLLKGGGGTNFCPAFDALSARPRGRRPDVTIYLTDGMGTAPATPPPYRVVWALIGRGAAAPCKWGEVVKVTP